eukprot:TRINITY_DN24537_c0_g1_i4.p1 TRINITY_DN24537_c0_g1~~TRINITY_DN24537_c0_g1_i4.p1  ORF type:complete len:808 (+),score=119.61 TRINITY_DN24537_c0_g1_i4:358-2781(+)
MHSEWALQIYASDDGVRAQGLVGSPVRIMVAPQDGFHAGRPELLCEDSPAGQRMILIWTFPPSNAGVSILGHELHLWEAQAWHERALPLVTFRGWQVQPPFHIEGLSSDGVYVARVRIHTVLGPSLWSELSLPLRLGKPGKLARPEVLEVSSRSATLRWRTSFVPITYYEIWVEPQYEGAESWLVHVTPPPIAPPSPKDRGPRKPEPRIDATVTLESGGKYQFRCRGINDHGHGPLSEPSCVIETPPSVPTAPGTPKKAGVGQTNAQHGHFEVALKWAPAESDPACPVLRYFVRGRVVSRANSYRSSCSEGAVDADLGCSDSLEWCTPGNTCNLLVDGLKGNTRYVFFVHALNKGGLSASSPQSSVITTEAALPEPPTRLRLQHIDNQSLTVDWQAPEDDGGSFIEGYEVLLNDKDTGRRCVDFIATGLSADVSGLRGNSVYTLQVRSLTHVGCSEAATLDIRTGPVPPGRPGAPRAKLEGVCALTASLAWSPPEASGGAPILGYSVTFHQSYLEGSPKAAMQGTMQTDVIRATFSELEPRCRYQFRVRAHNEAGDGEPSAWSVVLQTGDKLSLAQPEPPQLVAATATSLLVTWPHGDEEAPELVSEEVPEYELVCLQACETWSVAGDGDAARQVADASATSCTVRVPAPPVCFSQLQVRSAYLVWLRRRGRGEWSDWSPATEILQTTSTWSKQDIIDVASAMFGSINEMLEGIRDGGGDAAALEEFTNYLRQGELPADVLQEVFLEFDQVMAGQLSIQDLYKLLCPWMNAGDPGSSADEGTTSCSQHVQRGSGVATVSVAADRHCW